MHEIAGLPERSRRPLIEKNKTCGEGFSFWASREKGGGGVKKVQTNE